MERLLHVSGGLYREKNGTEVFKICDGMYEFCSLSTLVQQFIEQSDEVQMYTKDEEKLLSTQIIAKDFDETVIRDLWSIGNLTDAKSCGVFEEGSIESLTKTIKYAQQTEQVRHFHTQGLSRQIVPYDKNNHAFGHPALQCRFIAFEVLPSGILRVVPCLTTFSFLTKDKGKFSLVSPITEHLEFFLTQLLANILISHEDTDRGSKMIDRKATKRHIGIGQSLLNDVAAKHPGEYKVDDLDFYCKTALLNRDEFINKPNFIVCKLEIQRKLVELGQFKFTCGACKKAAETKKCAACGRIQYCSKKCQKLDWKTHKKYCINFFLQ